MDAILPIPSGHQGLEPSATAGIVHLNAGFMIYNRSGKISRRPLMSHIEQFSIQGFEGNAKDCAVAHALNAQRSCGLDARIKYSIGFDRTATNHSLASLTLEHVFCSLVLAFDGTNATKHFRNTC